MSNFKAALLDISILDKNLKIGFVIANFNSEYTHELEQINRDFLNENWFYNIESYYVPGAFEIPWFTKKLLESFNFSILITIWVVIKGDTPHFDYVCGESSRWIMDLNLKYDIPVLFWILTCLNSEQVTQRLNHSLSIAALNLLVEKRRFDMNEKPCPKPFCWEVIKWKKLGRTIWFPTANIIIDSSKNKEIAEGTYKIFIKIWEETYNWVGVYLKNENKFEAHIFWFDYDIYWQIIEIHLVQKIRDNKKFNSLEDLKKQIEKDVAYCKASTKL